MSAVRSVILMLCLAAAATAQTRALAVNAGVPPGLDPTSTRILQSELQKLLQPAAIDVTWQGAGVPATTRDFELLVVGSFSGSCAVDVLPSFSPHPVPSRSLGDSIVLRDGVL